ncbi:MAG: VOC family protein [Rhodanobacter sp.]
MAFFRNVLDCTVIGPGSSTSHDAAVSRLLSCGEGSFIELTMARRDALPVVAPSPPSADLPLRFWSHNVAHVAVWLRHEGISVTAPPYRLTTGPLAGCMALDFTAPWGLRLQLLDSCGHPPAMRWVSAEAHADGR